MISTLILRVEDNTTSLFHLQNCFKNSYLFRNFFRIQTVDLLGSVYT